MKVKTILLAVFLLMFAYQANYCFAQEDESSESILEREEFILTRRAGGPGMKIAFDAYSQALIQKSKIVEDKFVPDSKTKITNWFSINPIGMFYQRTNANYISGRTNSIAFHPDDVNILYIAAAQGGV